MPVVDHAANAYPLWSRINGFKGVITMIYSLRQFDGSEIAKQRMKILKFYNQYGEHATREAFGADRKLVSRWKKRLQGSNGKLSSLIPVSTRPHTLRTPLTDPVIIAFIRQEREAHPRIGKEKLKPDVDEYCQRLGIPSISISTIGNVIKRHRFFFQKAGKVYHDPNSAWAQKRVQRQKRLRIRHSPRPETNGHILSDAVERITDGVKDYFISAIDARMKFALTLRYQRLTSTNMKDFYHRFRTVYPGTIRVWQSDNGGENLGVFDQQLEKDHIPHLFIYPRCPKIDTFIERYNRTVQEEFIDEKLDLIHDRVVFGEKLVEWNLYYNTRRRHHSLGLRSPLQYLIEEGGMSHKCLTYTAG